MTVIYLAVVIRGAILSTRNISDNNFFWNLI